MSGAELLLVNPRRRRRRKAASSSSRKRRRRVVRMARNPRKRRGMSALQRRYFGGGKRRRKSSRRSVVTMASNPRRRRRHHRSRKSFSVFRRNPVGLTTPIRYTEEMIPAAAGGAVGGLAIDYIFNNFPTLYNLSYVTRTVAKLAVAGVLGYAVGKGMKNSRIGATVAAGASTVIVYDIAQQYLALNTQYGPSFGMGRYAAMNGVRTVGRLKGHNGMGFINPARTGKMGRYAMGRYVTH